VLVHQRYTNVLYSPITTPVQQLGVRVVKSCQLDETKGDVKHLFRRPAVSLRSRGPRWTSRCDWFARSCCRVGNCLVGHKIRALCDSIGS